MFRLSILILALSLAAGEAAFAQSECGRPAATTVPDGASASLEQMLEAQTGVRDFLAAMEAYLDCMNAQIESADEETPPETVNGWIELYNAAVSEMEALANRFNEERVAYQQAHPSE
ncbi:MAG: hypothetical protein PVG24_12205 [Gammaproteobacteria bacterium]|jgi:hypothetical protein